MRFFWNLGWCWKGLYFLLMQDKKRLYFRRFRLKKVTVLNIRNLNQNLALCSLYKIQFEIFWWLYCFWLLWARINHQSLRTNSGTVAKLGRSCLCFWKKYRLRKLSPSITILLRLKSGLLVWRFGSWIGRKTSPLHSCPYPLSVTPAPSPPPHKSGTQKLQAIFWSYLYLYEIFDTFCR